MRELRIHGRGGQGSVSAAELITTAAFTAGVYSQAFPAFGVERRGAPVQAFVRFSDEKIRLRSQIYEPDYIIVQDSTLIHDVNVFSGMSEGGIAIINTEKDGAYNLPNGVKLIKKAYVTLVKEFHPDHAGSSEDKQQEYNERLLEIKT